MVGEHFVPNHTVALFPSEAVYPVAKNTTWIEEEKINDILSYLILAYGRAWRKLLFVKLARAGSIRCFCDSRWRRSMAACCYAL